MFATIIVMFSAHTINHVNKNNQQLRLKNIQLKNTQVELDKLESDYETLDLDKTKSETEKQQKIDQLETERQRLEKELQAKRILKEQEAKALAAARPKTVRTASVPTTGNCAQWLAQAGVTDTASAMHLIRRESNCNPNAVNKSSGACGIGQALPCSKMGCAMGDGACQVRWMNQYVIARYGTWANALGHSLAHNWY